MAVRAFDDVFARFESHFKVFVKKNGSKGEVEALLAERYCFTTSMQKTTLNQCGATCSQSLKRDLKDVKTNDLADLFNQARDVWDTEDWTPPETINEPKAEETDPFITGNTNRN